MESFYNKHNDAVLVNAFPTQPTQISIKKDTTVRLILTSIVISALIVRLFVAFTLNHLWFSTDTYDYFNMANAILAGHPIAKFPNGLPLLIAFTETVFHPNHAPLILICLNIILSTSLVWMTAKIAIKISNKNYVGIIAALIVAFYPNQLDYTRLILSDIPACFLITFTAFLFLKEKYFYAGLTLFIATLFRTNLLLVFPFIFMVGLYFLYKSQTKIKLSNFLCGYLLGVMLYTIMINTGMIASTNRYSYEILKSLNANSLMEEYPSPANFSENEKAHPIHTYFQFALNNPSLYLKQRIYALENLWGWPPSPGRGLLAKILISVRLPLFILGLIGFWKYREKLDSWILLAPIIALSIIHVAMYSSPRYTVPVEPLLICLASLFFSKRSMEVNQYGRK